MTTTPRSGGAFVDYYALLKVPPEADEATISRRIKEERRHWRRLTELSDLGRRQEAERRMANLGEASKVLLDSGRRAAYDRVRRNRPRGSAENSDVIGGYDPLERAEKALSVNDYRQGAFFAEEAARTANSAKAWNLRSRAYTGLGEGQRAVVAAQEAVALEPDDPMFHVDLGMAYMALGESSSAIESFQRAAPLSEDEVIPLGLAADVQLMERRPGEAVRLLRRLLSDHPKDVRVKDALADALLMQAETIPSEQDLVEGTYTVISAEEISQMEKVLDQAERVGAKDAEVLSSIRTVRSFLERSAEKTVDFRAFNRAKAAQNSGMGCFLFFIHILPLGGLFMALTAMGDGQGQIAFVCLIIALAGFGLWWLYMVIPRWKQSRRDEALIREFRARGLM